EDFGVVTLGYAVMRVGLVVQWLRAAGADPERRATAVRYAVGVSACMAGWGLRLLLPDGWRLPSLVAMAALELLVPVWAERGTTTTWHPHHIAERYGLFTLIVLGESVLAATVALQSALDSGQALGDLLTIAAGGLLVVFSMWWIYFAQPADRTMEAARRAFGITSNFSFVWGYGHVVVFAAAAAVGAGIAVAVDEATHHAELSGRGAALSVAVPAALYVITIWALHGGHRQARSRTAHAASFPLAAAAVVVAAAATGSVLVVGLLMAALVATFLLSGEPTPAGGSVVVDGG
ncbi:MAG TPA: low temperature requirement protein A, partial [Acidimicrobiales bacterium]